MYQSRFADVREARDGAEPGVLVRGVVRHQVEDHADAAPVRLGKQAVEVAERAEQRIDRACSR